MQSNTAKKQETRTGGLDLLNLVHKADATTRDRYLITIKFLDKVLGGQPKSKEIMRKWLESKLAKEAAKAAKKGLDIPTKEQQAQIVDLQVANMQGQSVDEVLDREEDKAWTGFFIDDQGIWMGTYQLEACVRDIITSLGVTIAKRGSKQTKQHLFQIWQGDAEGKVLPYEQGQRLRFYRDGKPVTTPDNYIEMTAHVMTAQGPRSVIKRHDYVEQAELSFVLTTANKKAMLKREAAHLNEKDIAKILSFMQGNALGCSRSQGFGKFDVIGLVKLEV